MDNARKQSRAVRIMILAMAVFACTWFLSSGAGLAASASSSINVKVTVLDAIGVETGRSALSPVTDYKNSQVITKFVTRAASSRLGGQHMFSKVDGTGVFTNADQSTEHGASRLSFDDVAPGDEMQENISASEMIITVSML